MDTPNDPRIAALPAPPPEPAAHPGFAALPPAPVGPFSLPDFAKIVAAQRHARDPKLFQLLFTADEPFDVQVRRLNLADRAQIGDLPTAMQDRVVQFFDKTNRSAGGRLTLDRVVRNLGDSEDRNNLYCLIGFVSPRLVERDEDADPERGVWPLSAVDLRDRQRYFDACAGNDEAAARQFRPLPRG